jgi:hypothetical protein
MSALVIDFDTSSVNIRKDFASRISKCISVGASLFVHSEGAMPKAREIFRTTFPCTGNGRRVNEDSIIGI